MNRILFWAICAFAAVSFSACGNKTARNFLGGDSIEDTLGIGQEGDAFGTIVTENVESSFDWGAPGSGTGSASFKAYIDYPVKGKKVVVDSIRKWISNQFGGTYQGDFSKGKLIADYYGKHYIKELSEDKEMTWNNELSNTIRLCYDQTNFVTYCNTNSSYSGGAHGMYSSIYAVFNKENGHPMRIGDIFPEKNLTEVRAIVKKGLKEQYVAQFKGSLGKVMKAKEPFPLPTNPVGLLEKGMIFQYVPYEIGSYAEGDPSCTISYKELKPLMKPEVQAWFP